MPIPAMQRRLFDYCVRNVIALSYLSGDADNIFALFTPYPSGTQTLAMCRSIANLLLHLLAAILAHRPALIPAVQAFLLTSHLLSAVALLHSATCLHHLSHTSSQVRDTLNNMALPVHLALETIVSQLKISPTMKAKMTSTHLKDPLARIPHTTIFTSERNHPFGAPVQDATLQVSTVPSPRSNKLIILT